ncbi:MAG: bifunctional pyr operon transcriptional regulator/uracil phosphoribosyltransferase PyrR [Streptococcaceae bacterium]|nr:bifunctional pyr operon transcriptional regulator/uracil phosphoribosyltransferase PyrR [Streptococcaceae bacterium]
MTQKEIIDAQTLQRTLTRLTYEIIEQNKNLDNIVLIGIKTRGVYLAQRIKDRIQQLENIELPLGDLDTRPFRDDEKATDDTSMISTDITAKQVILVDDVLYTGRTIRAAIDGLMTLGRPSQVQLAVLVDRGHRELPIRADYIGKNIPTARDEDVEVLLSEVDGKDSVTIHGQ